MIEEFRNREFDSKSALQDEVQDLREKLAKAEKKATIQANVHKLEDEVKSLLIKDEREELMLARREIHALKSNAAAGGTRDELRVKPTPSIISDEEHEELIELRKAVNLFTLEREQLIKSFAKQRSEWAKRLNTDVLAFDEDEGPTEKEVLELQNTLELERTSFWEIMQDTNKHIAMMKQEQDKLVMENKKLRSQLKSRQSQQQDSVEKIRTILSNRGKASPIPIDEQLRPSLSERKKGSRGATDPGEAKWQRVHRLALKRNWQEKK